MYLYYSLLFCSMRIQECQTSPVQTPVEFKFYVDESLNQYTLKDMGMDSNLNQYLYYMRSTGGNAHVSKMNTNGDIVWSKEYPNTLTLLNVNSMQITNDESTIRFLGFQAPNDAQIFQIATCKY